MNHSQIVSKRSSKDRPVAYIILNGYSMDRQAENQHAHIPASTVNPGNLTDATISRYPAHFSLKDFFFFFRQGLRIQKSRHLETYRKLMPQMTAGQLHKHKYQHCELGLGSFTMQVIDEIMFSQDSA